MERIVKSPPLLNFDIEREEELIEVAPGVEELLAIEAEVELAEAKATRIVP
jgi:hypothetical protein